MTSFVEKAVFECAPIDTAQCVIRCMVHSGRQWSNVAPKQKLNKQTNKQIKQTNNTVSMSSSMVVWWVRSHIELELAPILPLILLCVCMVSSLPYCMQRANTDACIHETCNVRTQMHADRNSARPMHAYMKHTMCEHRSMQTGTVQGANNYACGGECEGYVNYGPSPFICQGLRKSIQCICECIPMLEFAPSQVSTCAAVRCSFVVLQFAALRSNAKTQTR